MRSKLVILFVVIVSLSVTASDDSAAPHQKEGNVTAEVVEKSREAVIPADIILKVNEKRQSAQETKSKLGDVAEGSEVEESPQSQEDASRGRLLVAVQKTLQITAITTTTSTVAPSCLVGTAPTNECMNRRKKRSLPLGIDTSLDYEVDSSLENDPGFDGDTSEDQSRQGRLVLWSTSTVTFTFTSTIAGGNVLSISYGCSFAGLPDACPP